MCGGKREESQAEEQDGKRGSKRRESGKAEFGERDGRGEREREKERQDEWGGWGGGREGATLCLALSPSLTISLASLLRHTTSRTHVCAAPT